MKQLFLCLVYKFCVQLVLVVLLKKYKVMIDGDMT